MSCHDPPQPAVVLSGNLAHLLYRHLLHQHQAHRFKGRRKMHAHLTDCGAAYARNAHRPSCGEADPSANSESSGEAERFRCAAGHESRDSVSSSITVHMGSGGSADESWRTRRFRVRRRRLRLRRRSHRRRLCYRRGRSGAATRRSRRGVDALLVGLESLREPHDLDQAVE